MDVISDPLRCATMTVAGVEHKILELPDWTLCRPCHVPSDCVSPGGVVGYCVSYGDAGAFCSRTCAESADCPAGFSCAVGNTMSAGPLPVCVGSSDTCGCTMIWAEERAATSCLRRNGFGACRGARECVVEDSFAELTECSAQDPEIEVKNGEDDDCDGEVDEGVCTCGDGLCRPECDEDSVSCYADCANCGDGECTPPEMVESCPVDCMLCGDKLCSEGETFEICPQDCGFCGDEACTAPENLESCPHDCATCGDHLCSPGESPVDCPEDCCPGGCGDAICLGYSCGENPQTCPADCGTACGNGVCDRGENPSVCAEDCDHKVCGNGICEGDDGGPDQCPQDCKSYCGDCECEPEHDEFYATCAIDCSYCGDGVCSPCDRLNENLETCPQDCCIPTLEVCNGRDDDCDGRTDEQFALGCRPIYRDADGDGVGLARDSRCLCAPAGEYRAAGPGDCDDHSKEVTFGALERCNGVDDNCDGQTDETFGVGERCETLAEHPCRLAVRACDAADPSRTVCLPGAPRAAGSLCSEFRCEGSELTLAAVCDAAGTCLPMGTISCGAYACREDALACRTSCSAPEHCSPDHTCADGTCR